MSLAGNCRTTAMGILPHSQIKEAVDLALTMDIPFWPQLPHYSYYEDMYVQVSEHFPGIFVDTEQKRITLDTSRFYEELEDYAVKSGDDGLFKLSSQYSAAFDAFMARDLSSYEIIRGQSIGPISFGLKIVDENLKPIIYNDDLRGFLYEFIARKTNVQYRQLREKHPNTFVWVDEPGLEIIFGSFTGYASDRAKKDFAAFLSSLEGPKGVHLCGNPDWSFLLSGLELDILSIDAYGCGEIFTRYADEVRAFLDAGNIISWGIVPTLTEDFSRESVEELVKRLEGLWSNLTSVGISMDKILKQAWLAPARCCLINSDGHLTVENSYRTLTEASKILRDKYSLYD
ncbi:MAG: uroporphyrinogen decarboxylase/cobalamine-independent methonine synthase family protein [Desulfocucumaceae bacterium]